MISLHPYRHLGATTLLCGTCGGQPAGARGEPVPTLWPAHVTGRCGVVLEDEVCVSVGLRHLDVVDAVAGTVD